MKYTIKQVGNTIFAVKDKKVSQKISLNKIKNRKIILDK